MYYFRLGISIIVSRSPLIVFLYSALLSLPFSLPSLPPSPQPCVSVGNVAQLTVDVIINTLQLARVGHLHHPSLLPLVGSAAYSHTTHCLHTAAEGEEAC